MTTNTTGAHRPENVTGPSPAFTEPPRTRHDGGTPAAGAIRADAWRTQAAATLQDLEAARTLRSLRNRGARA